MSVCPQPLSHISASVDVTAARQLDVTAPNSSAAVLERGDSHHLQEDCYYAHLLGETVEKVLALC